MSYLKKEHKNNIHRPAFNDIANVFLDLVDEYNNQLSKYIATCKGEEIDEEYDMNKKIQWVCDASMGHGKTSVLITWLKWLVSEPRPSRRIPVLLAIRENGMAEEIYEALDLFKEGSVLRIDADNIKADKDLIPMTQIIIITHSRMDNLALGFGNKQLFKIWENEYGNGRYFTRRHRLLIVDEKPSFVNSSIFGIDSFDNALKWVNKLFFTLNMNPFEAQIFKSKIIMLVSNHLVMNKTSITTPLSVNQDATVVRSILDTINEIKKHEKARTQIDAYKTMIHFENLIQVDGYGRIDDYKINGYAGRKIMVAERIHYSELGLNMMVLDGTADLTRQQYNGEFELKSIKNYNDYSRLTLIQDVINTSKYSREKKGHTTQKAISERIKKLYKNHSDMFVLPVKSDISIYKKFDAIKEEYKKSFDGTANDNSKPINLLNTTGKNIIKDVTSLYLTSLPKMNADHYKCIAISLYGNNINLEIREKEDDDNNLFWFKDIKLELVYRSEMYAEILQIIHRTALRKIEQKIPINIYIAYDDSNNDSLILNTQVVMSELAEWYLTNVKYDWNRVHDPSLYARGEKIRDFASRIKEELDSNKYGFGQYKVRLSKIDKVGKEFRLWLKNHNNWKTKRELIETIFEEYGLSVIEVGDKKIKHIQIN